MIDYAGSLEIDRSFFSAVRFRVYRFPAFWSFEQVVWLDQEKLSFSLHDSHTNTTEHQK